MRELKEFANVPMRLCAVLLRFADWQIKLFTQKGMRELY